MQKLKEKGSCPIQILKEDGDWSSEQFWVVIRFLKNESRSSEILQVFYKWRNMHKSRIDKLNYSKIIGLLCKEGLMEEALAAFQDMKIHGLTPSLKIYNSFIHDYAQKGKFNDAFFFINEMKEMDLMPDINTYNGLIQAYGRHKMYDEMNMCLKNLKVDGCSPDEMTYNLLIQEFSKAGLLKKMEKAHRTMLTKEMHLQSSALLAMLEAYANFGIVKSMEKAYNMAMTSNVPLGDELIRKMAGVYIENYMFSRLDDLGRDLFFRSGRTDLVWCLSLLSRACLFSHQGMEYIIEQMKATGISWNVTIANIILLAYSKMKYITLMRHIFFELPTHHVKPDIITIGILFDAICSGFDGTEVLETWRRLGFLDEAVELNTDSLVLTAFGKGNFLRSCEQAYLSVKPEARGDTWTYNSLIELVLRQRTQSTRADAEVEAS